MTSPLDLTPSAHANRPRLRGDFVPFEGKASIPLAQPRETTARRDRETLSRRVQAAVQERDPLLQSPTRQPIGTCEHCPVAWASLLGGTSNLSYRTVMEGLLLDFIPGKVPNWATPNPQLPFNPIQKDQQLAATTLVQEMEARGVIECVDRVALQIISPIFLVQKDLDKFRFILNLKSVNQSLTYQKFKMENLSSALLLLNKGCWCAKIDLADAYYSLKIHPRHRRYLGFHWNGQFYWFLRMPNGLSQAPRRFSKLMRKVVGRLRAMGIVLVIYLDDILLISRDRDRLVQQLSVARELLLSLGFVINERKSTPEPVQQVQFLGFVLNTAAMTISLPEEKRESLRAQCVAVLSAAETSARDLARLIGGLHAADPAIKIARLHYRALQRLKISASRRRGWLDRMVQLTPEARVELKWWIHYLARDRPVDLMPVTVEDAPIEVFTDSSLTMWGGFCRGEGVQGRWSDRAQMCHINLLELRAAHKVLKHFFGNARDLSILLRIDNMVAMHYIRKMGGTKSCLLSQAALDLWEWLLERNLSLTAEYIPTGLNSAADLMSRQKVSDQGYSLHPRVYQMVVNKWGNPILDLFASSWNTKTRDYVSWGFDPKAVGQDALAHQTVWPPRGLLYAYPPTCLVTRTLRKLDRGSSVMILIAPEWPTQCYYPLLLERSLEPPLDLPDQVDLITDREGQPHPLQQVASLRLKAWRVTSLACVDKVSQSGRQSISD